MARIVVIPEEPGPRYLELIAEKRKRRLYDLAKGLDFKGRTLSAGTVEDPENWYMSSVGDPFTLESEKGDSP